jgi:hypothetical protein
MYELKSFSHVSLSGRVVSLTFKQSGEKSGSYEVGYACYVSKTINSPS